MKFTTIPPQHWNLKLSNDFSPKAVSKPKPELQKPKTEITVDTGLQKKLFNLLNGDRDMCKRLIDASKRKYSGQSEQWYWEKVICDLLRDRA